MAVCDGEEIEVDEDEEWDGIVNGVLHEGGWKGKAIPRLLIKEMWRSFASFQII